MESAKEYPTNPTDSSDESDRHGAPSALSAAKLELARLTRRYVGLKPYFLSLLRVVAASTFVLAGTTKLLAFPGPLVAGGGPVPLFSEFGLAGVIEVCCGTLILIGWATRPLAFVLSGEMAIAYLQVHLPNSVWPTVNGGLPALLYCFLWLYISAAGGGAFGVDAGRHAAESADR